MRDCLFPFCDIRGIPIGIFYRSGGGGGFGPCVPLSENEYRYFLLDDSPQLTVCPSPPIPDTSSAFSREDLKDRDSARSPLFVFRDWLLLVPPLVTVGSTPFKRPPSTSGARTHPGHEADRTDREPREVCSANGPQTKRPVGSFLEGEFSRRNWTPFIPRSLPSQIVRLLSQYIQEVKTLLLRRYIYVFLRLPFLVRSNFFSYLLFSFRGFDPRFCLLRILSIF